MAAAHIKSGILYLESFIENNNLFPTDLARQLGYIRTLDKRIEDLKVEADQKLARLVDTWPAAPDAQANSVKDVPECLEIDSIHAEIIHFQEEKLVFVAQIEEMLRSTAAELAGIHKSLQAEIDLNGQRDVGAGSLSRGEPPGAGGSNPHLNLHLRSSQPSMSSLGGSRHGHGGASASLPAAVSGLGSQDFGGSVPALDGRRGSAPALQPIGSQRSQRGGELLGPSASMGGASGANGLHASNSAVGLSASTLPAASAAALPVAVPGVADDAANLQLCYFEPLDPSMLPFAERPQAQKGVFLKLEDITPALLERQAELLWPDDNLWYLIKITRLDAAARRADIMYITGETEQDLNLEEIAQKREMRIIQG